MDEFAPLTTQELEIAAKEQTSAGSNKDMSEIVLPVPQDAPQPSFTHATHGKPSGRWAYTDAAGQIMAYVCRFDKPDGGKEILPYTLWQTAQGVAWKWKGLPAPRPLFGLKQLADNPHLPVLVVEGEKTAMAARDLLPTHVVITSMGGANAAGKTDWSPFAGRVVTIWPDADAAGLKYAQEVAALAEKSGAQAVFIVNTLDLPDGWDLADAAPDGLNIHQRLAEAQAVEPPSAYISFGEFTMDANGLTVEIPVGRGENKKLESRTICRAFEVVGRCRDPHGEGWAKYIEWVDDDGRTHTHAVADADLHGDLKALCAVLASKGLSIAIGAQSYLAHYLNRVRVDAKVTMVSRTGWHDVVGYKVFALLKASFGAPDDERVIFTGGGASPYETRGTLEDWKLGVGKLVSGHSRLVLAVSMSFAGVLLAATGADGGGVNLFGQSSKGKSTCAEAAASVWGKGSTNGFVRSWRATGNALEASASLHSDTILILDELGVVDAKEAANAIYQLSNGAGKGRAMRDGSLRNAMTWRVLLLSTGELPMAAKIMEDRGRKAHAGQQVRLLDIPADAGFGFGAFNSAGGFADAGQLSNAIKAAARSNYGTAGAAFVRTMLKEGFSDVGALVNQLIQKFCDHHLPAGADGQVKRAAARLGLIAAAGELATTWGITPWREGEAMGAAGKALLDWIAQRGGVGAAEITDGIAQVRAFLEKYGESRFEPVEGSDIKVNERAGWRRGYGDDRKWLILPEVWKNTICAGLNPTTTARALAEAGILTPDTSGKFSRTEATPIGNKRVYVIGANILEGGE